MVLPWPAVDLGSPDVVAMKRPQKGKHFFQVERTAVAALQDRVDGATTTFVGKFTNKTFVRIVIHGTTRMSWNVFGPAVQSCSCGKQPHPQQAWHRIPKVTTLREEN